MRKEDGEGEAGTGDGNAARVVYLQALGGIGLVKHDGLVTDEAATAVADGERDGGNERRLVKDDPIIGKGIVDAQVVAVRDKLAVAVDAQIGHIVGRQSGRVIEGRGEVVDAETDIMGSAAWIDNGALAGRQRLVEGETGQAVAEADKRGRENATRGTIRREAVPQREDTRHQQGDKGGVEDEGGKGSPGISIGIEIGDGFIAIRGNGTNAIVTPAQLGAREAYRVGMNAGDAFKGILVEFLAAPDDGMGKVLPDGGRTIERANDDTERENTEQEQEVPAREDGKELERVENGRERAIARQGGLLHPGSIVGRIVERFTGGLHKVDAEQADDGDSGDEQDGSAHRTEPAPGRVNRIAKYIGDALAEVATRPACIVFRCASSGASGGDRSGRFGYGGGRFARARLGRGGGGRDKSRSYRVFLGIGGPG